MGSQCEVFGPVRRTAELQPTISLLPTPWTSTRFLNLKALALANQRKYWWSGGGECRVWWIFDLLAHLTIYIVHVCAKMKNDAYLARNPQSRIRNEFKYFMTKRYVRRLLCSKSWSTDSFVHIFWKSEIQTFSSVCKLWHTNNPSKIVAGALMPRSLDR